MASSRQSTKARTDRFQDLGGAEVFNVASEASEAAVLSGPAFTEKERNFLIERLTTEVAEFSVAANCQIFARCLVQTTEIARLLQKNGQEGRAKGKRSQQGEWVLAIHGFGNLTTSWTWMKARYAGRCPRDCFSQFAVGLYKKGFNVLLIDLPGFGKSSISQNIRCSPEPAALQVLSELGVHQCRVVACYEGAGMLFKLLMKYPHLIGSHHFLYNPVIDDDALDTYCSQLRLTSKIRALGSAFNVFVAYDRSPYGGLVRPDVREVTERTFNALTEISQDHLCKDRVFIASVTRHEIAERLAYKAEQPGLASVRILYPSKYFRVYVAEFIAGSRVPPYSSVTPLPIAGVDLWGGRSELTQSLKCRGRDATGRTRHRTTNAPYGSRLQRQEDGLRMETLLQESMKEYLDEYGEEEANVRDALAQSQVTAENERASGQGGLCAVLIAAPVRDARLAELRSLPAGGDAVDELREMQGGIEESMGTLDLYHGYSEEEQMRLAIANSLKENLPKRDCTVELSPRWLESLFFEQHFRWTTESSDVVVGGWRRAREAVEDPIKAISNSLQTYAPRRSSARRAAACHVDTAIAGAFDLFYRTLAAADPCGGMLF
ncbi:hypothetical protein FOZ60_006852 [Perkinsus olseni]|uniref:Uncharacterized protein n=1 Tax=Perkinsus olseni TaxID=32597 RepID=A0A7J6NMJ8_PEROL|nr:hypothetical protein FOZ60_006852 [Perkinsus olseni]